MSLGKAKWITIDEFVSVVEEYGVDVSMIQLWIDNKELTVKYSDDLFVLTDYKYNSLLYKILFLFALAVIKELPAEFTA